MNYQRSLRVEKDNKHQLSLMVIYQLSLKVERKYIIASPFTDDELPTFTEGSKKITNIDVHCRWSTNFHLR